MRTQPILVLCNGIAAVVNLVLGALAVTGAIAWDEAQIAAVVAAVQGGANLVALVLRASVYSPATHEAEVQAALLTPVTSARRDASGKFAKGSK